MATPLTANQQFVIAQARALLPDNFDLANNDAKLLAFINLTLADFNMFPPMGSSTVDSIAVDPQSLQIVLFGVSVFALMFQQMRATLEDFTFSDQGFTVQVDQVGKIQTSMANMLEVYKMMIMKYKAWLIIEQGPLGIGSPRYQSQIGQFLKIALGSTFTWNSP